MISISTILHVLFLIFIEMALGNNNSNTMSTSTPSPVTPPKTPAFIFTESTGRIDGYELSKKIMEVAGDSNVKCVQELQKLWRVYLTTEAAKTELVSKGITVNGKFVKVYRGNPFVTGSIHSIVSGFETEVEMIRVLIKDLCLSVPNEDVHHMFTEVFKIKLSSDITDGYYRDRRSKLSTKVMSGDRIVWVHPDQLETPLPRYAQCGTKRCRIFHRGQFKDSECYNCFSTDHKSQNCPNPRACKVCKQPGHDPGSPDCDHYVPVQNLRPYGGYQDPLSNHHEDNFEFRHVPAKTVDNHYFYHKAMLNGQEKLANMCLNAPTGAKAKFLSKGIRCTKDWDNSEIGVNLMMEIQRERFEQVNSFVDAIQDAHINGQYMVEAVPNSDDHFWGSGLDKEATLHTDPDFWPGDNKMGQILNNLAVEKYGSFMHDGSPGRILGVDTDTDDDDCKSVSESGDPESTDTQTDKLDEKPQPTGEQGNSSNQTEAESQPKAEQDDASVNNALVRGKMFSGESNGRPRYKPKREGRSKLLGECRTTRSKSRKGSSRDRSPRSQSVKRASSSPIESCKSKQSKHAKMVNEKFSDGVDKKS